MKNVSAKRILLGCLVSFLLLGMLSGSGLDQIIFLFVAHAGFGWLLFLFHVVPAIHWNPMAIATAVVCVAFLLVGTHSFMVWFSRSCQAGRADATPWRKSWTAGLVSLVVLAFIAGTAMVGATHQITWLSTSSEPWIKRESWHSDSLVNRFAFELNDLHAEKKPLPADLFRRMCNEAVAADQRLVVLNDKDGLTRFVAVGAYDPGSSGWKRCSYFWWTGTEGETHPKQGFFNGDQWASLIAEAESGRPLDHFGR